MLECTVTKCAIIHTPSVDIWVDLKHFVKDELCTVGLNERKRAAGYTVQWHGRPTIEHLLICMGHCVTSVQHIERLLYTLYGDKTAAPADNRSIIGVVQCVLL